MNCDESGDRVTDRLNGLLEPASARALDEHLAHCAGCRDEAAQIERLWVGMDALDEPVPSERMRARFHAALAAYEARRPAGRLAGFLERLGQVWPSRPALQFGVAAGALVVGLLLGGGLDRGSADEIRALRQEVQAEMQAMHRTVSLSLLDHPSASERLRGVESSRKAGDDATIVAALLDRVENDPSVNVRLSALSALAPRAADPAVGGPLLQALPRQASPVVQVRIAELLLAADVDGSREAVGALLDEESPTEGVQEHLQALMLRAS